MDELSLKIGLHQRTKCGACEFNAQVDCDTNTRCAACGWNPAVSAERSGIIRERMKKEDNILWIIGHGSFEKLS